MCRTANDARADSTMMSTLPETCRQRGLFWAMRNQCAHKYPSLASSWKSGTGYAYFDFMVAEARPSMKGQLQRLGNRHGSRRPTPPVRTWKLDAGFRQPRL